MASRYIKSNGVFLVHPIHTGIRVVAENGILGFLVI